MSMDLEEQVVKLLSDLDVVDSEKDLKQAALRLKTLELLHKIQGSSPLRDAGEGSSAVHPAARAVQK